MFNFLKTDGIDKIETAFLNLKAEILAKKQIKKEGKHTGMQNCIQYMLDFPERVWFPSYDFCGRSVSNGGWLSHKGQARISELAIQNPKLVETRKIGRIHVYRLCTENMDGINKFLNL